MAGEHEDDLLKLRQILLADALERLDQLESVLLDDQQRVERLSQDLARALRQAGRNDNALAASMLPLWQHNMQSAVRANRKLFTEALFPVIGPTIRKSIAEAFAAFAERVEQTMTNSFSPRALSWRFEAWRRGVAYSDFLLAKTLVYRVDAVLLIQTVNGLLVDWVGYADALQADEDAASAMLTAIVDFVQETVQDDDDRDGQTGLGSARVGQHSVVIERGPSAMLAAFVRGQPPADLRAQLQQTVETLHDRFSEELAAFSGERTEPSLFHDWLEPCLRQESVTSEEQQSRRVWWWLLVAFMVTSAVAFGIHQHWQTVQAAETIEARYRAQPGYVITTFDRDGRQITVSGLRDPLASPPEIGEDFEVIERFQPFLSLDEQLVAARVNGAKIPEHMTWSLSGQTIRLAGRSYDSEIAAWSQRLLTIPGIAAVDTEQLIDTEALVERELEQALGSLADQTIKFMQGTELALPQQLETVMALLHRINRAAMTLQRTIVVRVIGESDSTGAATFNRRIRQQRAEIVVEKLSQVSLPRVRLLPDGPTGDASGDSRQVTFEIDDQ